MSMTDVLAPALYVMGAIALVAAAYFGFTALKDRSARRREEDLTR